MTIDLATLTDVSAPRRIASLHAQLTGGTTTTAGEGMPNSTTQAPILNVGYFSHAVFNVVLACFGNDANRFVAEVETIEQ